MYLVQEKLNKLHGVWGGAVDPRCPKTFTQNVGSIFIPTCMPQLTRLILNSLTTTAGNLDEATQAGLIHIIERLSFRDAILASPNHEEAAQRLTLQSPEVVQRIAQAEMQFSAYQSNLGAVSKESARINAKRMDPASWWAMYGKHLPLLCSFARTVLAQVTGSASACERNSWSTYKRIRARGVQDSATKRPTNLSMHMSQ